MKISQLKQDQDELHEREKQSLKQRYITKLALEKERVIQQNNQLLEESGDIDNQL